MSGFMDNWINAEDTPRRERLGRDLQVASSSLPKPSLESLRHLRHSAAPTERRGRDISLVNRFPESSSPIGAAYSRDVAPDGAGYFLGHDFDKIAAPAALKIRALAVVNFFLSHRGRCFNGWTELKISQYVLWHLLNGTVFVASEPPFEVALAVIAWPGNADAMQALAHYKMPQFVWQELPKNGDSILIADVAGDRKLMPEILKQVHGAWPDSPRKRLFTYRRAKLVELSWTTILRFSRSNEFGRFHA